MDKFDTAHRFTLQWEGGLTDDPADRGGITNYGVCIEFLKDCARLDAVYVMSLGIQLPVTRESIKALRQDQGRALFRWRFWEVPQFEQYGTPLAVTLYDCAVNHGVKRAIILAQRAFNSLSSGVRLAVDGIQGPLTRSALASLDPYKLAHAIVRERKAFYNAIVESRPNQRVFLKGWMNRANDLDRYLETL